MERARAAGVDEPILDEGIAMTDFRQETDADLEAPPANAAFEPAEPLKTAGVDFTPDEPEPAPAGIAGARQALKEGSDKLVGQASDKARAFADQGKAARRRQARSGRPDAERRGTDRRGEARRPVRANTPAPPPTRWPASPARSATRTSTSWSTTFAGSSVSQPGGRDRHCGSGRLRARPGRPVGLRGDTNGDADRA